MQKYPLFLEKLLRYLQKMPGVGRKTAERFAFEMTQWEKAELANFAQVVSDVTTSLSFCSDCGALQETTCPFCSGKNRDPHRLCVVASPRDVFFIEESGSFHGYYHVIERLLSPLEGVDARYLRLEALERRLTNTPIQEVIFAIESTVEGDATTLFLKQHLQKFSVTTSRLAMGIPLGLRLEYADGGTLARALSQRQEV
ncbi:MAG: recombination mediator RecR [Chlamydiota bacterium]